MIHSVFGPSNLYRHPFHFERLDRNSVLPTTLANFIWRDASSYPRPWQASCLMRTKCLAVEAAKNHRSSSQNPPESADEYLTMLEVQGVAQTTSALREYMGGLN